MKGSSLNSISAQYEVDYEATFRRKKRLKRRSVADPRIPLTRMTLRHFLMEGDLNEEKIERDKSQLNSVAYDKRHFEAFGEERNHLGRLINSDQTPIFIPSRPKKKVTSREINFNRSELKFRKTDEVFFERYSKASSPEKKPLKNRRHFVERHLKELHLLEYNESEWMKVGRDPLLQLRDDFTDETDHDVQNQTMILRTDGAKTSAGGSVTSLLNSTLRDTFRATHNMAFTTHCSRATLNNFFKGEAGKGGGRQSSRRSSQAPKRRGLVTPIARWNHPPLSSDNSEIQIRQVVRNSSSFLSNHDRSIIPQNAGQIPPVGYYNARLQVKDNGGGKSQSFTKAERTFASLANPTDPALISPFSQAQTGLYTSFIDRRGIGFEKQQSRDRVSYLKKIIVAQRIKDDIINPKKPFSFQEFLAQREREREEKEAESFPTQPEIAVERRAEKAQKMVKSLRKLSKVSVNRNENSWNTIAGGKNRDPGNLRNLLNV